MQTITTRPAQWADLQRLTQMITALAAFHGDTATLNIEALQRDIFGAQPWVYISVALQAGNIVGYAALSPKTKLHYCARGMDIQHMFVESTYRRQGIGRILIQEAIKQAKGEGCRYLTIGTRPENTKAQKAYRACGFTPKANAAHQFHMALSP